MRVVVEYVTEDDALCTDTPDRQMCAQQLAQSISRNAPLGWEIVNYQVFAS